MTIERSEMRQVFPTPLWIVDLKPDAARALNGKLMAEITALATPRPAVPKGANWQTDPVLHKLPQFAEFVSLIEMAARGALRSMRLEKYSMFVTGCWANINPPGGVNSSHTHPNNFLSGVYYVSIPQGADRIEFLDPRPQASVLMPQPEEFNLLNGNSATIEVRDGRLVLFPGWLVHQVPVNASSEERVSIAFNLMFHQFGETASAPLWKGRIPIKLPG